MASKQEIIKELLSMQKKFMDYEHENGVDPIDYFIGKDGHPLQDYAKKYRDLAMQVVDMAHQEVGSKA